MKKITIFSLALVLLAMTGACREEYLQTEPTETISNPNAQFKLNGLYNLMVNTGTGGTDLDHDDFGQKGYDIYMDLLSSDMVLGGTTYGWYSNIANYSDPVDYTRNTNYKPWRYYYRLIYAANDVISGLGGNEANAEDKAAMGQAKTIRAHAYYNLMQLYTPKYDPSALSIPVYTVGSAEGGTKVPQSEVYDLMINDLTESVTLLEGYARPNKGVINQNVARGILAYVYAAKGDYPKVVETAGTLVNTGGVPVTTKAQATGGFNDLNTSSWMWGFDLTLDNDLDLVSWWGQVDIFSYSYAWAGDPKAIDENLYNGARADDIRKTQFVSIVEFNPKTSILLDENGAPVIVNGEKVLSITKFPKGYTIESAFFDPETNPNDHYQVSAGDITFSAVPANKFFDPGKVIGGQRVIQTDYLYMRIDEFHLLYAEALAKTGQVPLAKTVYKNFLTNRLDDTSYVDGLSDAQLKADIYNNTRLEFWGEGKAYAALKRNQATVTRGANHLFFVGQSFNYDDNRLYLKIPQQEVVANPNL